MISRRGCVPCSLVLVGLVAGEVRASERPRDHDVWLTTAAPRRASDRPVVAVAHDPGRGVPSLLWSPATAPAPAWLPAEAAARLYLGLHREVYGVSREALAGLRLRFVHDTGRGGIVVALRQTVDGVEVFHGDVKVLVDRSHRLIGISGAPHPAAHAGAVRAFAGEDATAVAAALRDRHGVDVGLRAAGERAGWRRFELAGEGPRMDAPARVKRVYFPRGEALVPGRLVELQTRDGGGLAVYQYVIGDDGSVLYRHNATADAHTYRVWADEGGDHRPADGPMVDFTPHPTGAPGGDAPGVAAPVLITIDGFNNFADPWLAADAIETRGNNVDAYIDHDEPGGLQVEDGEFRGAVTAPGVFDWTYDLNQEPLATQSQSMAALTQLFYVNNWLHDWWYDSGFDEAAGNAQDDNYGRGGMDGDVLLAEGQDAALAGARNNANMSTPMDGSSPRMQMYLWTGLYTEATLIVNPLGQEYAGGLSKFGPSSYAVKGPLVRFEDGEGVSPTDGCEASTVDMSESIALVDRGNCTFETKVTFAGAAGALGVVIIDNVDAPEPIQPGNDNELEDPTVPTMAITMGDGAKILEGLAEGEQFVEMSGWSSVERDGTIDGMIIAHEWGHYLHHRLTECGSQACSAMSEGWGDFNALMLALREGDDLDGAYAGTTYANFDASGYYGIRRVPYSVNTRRNALTFRHISDGEALPTGHPVEDNGQPNSEVHNAGEIWTTMLWEAYVGLHRAHEGELEFEEVRRRMGDYVVGGLMMAPPAPTFTEQRDALLMAIAASSQDDFITVAEAFARRGAGRCAASPDKQSTTLVGVVEDYEVGASGVLLAAALAELEACDDDGVLDPDETARITVEVYNGGVMALPEGAVVEVVDPDPGLVFPDGPAVTLPALGPLERQTVTIDVALADEVTTHRPLVLQLRIDGAAACEVSGARTLRAEIAADVAKESASVDDVEAVPSVWAPNGGGSEAIWTRKVGATDGYHWHGDAVGRTSDTFLMSPALTVGEDALVISFDHAYKFEQTNGTSFDGGVVEVTSDGGKNWIDVATLVDFDYPGKIAAESNTLDKRDAFVGESEGYPARERVVIDLGTMFAGKTVHLGFRIGTDGGVGAQGWDIDNLEFAGITNTPFPTWADDPGCNAGETMMASSGSDEGESGQADEGGGCGCVTGDANRGWQTAPLLLLLGFGRRRSRG